MLLRDISTSINFISLNMLGEIFFNYCMSIGVAMIYDTIKTSNKSFNDSVFYASRQNEY